jgi:succinyl-CoA synthetase beta subunit
MKIHEYQAKEILRKYGVPVPNGEMANTLEEAKTAASNLFPRGSKPRRGQGADTRRRTRKRAAASKSPSRSEDAELHSKNILGMQLITHQTGPGGQKVQRLLIEEASAIDRELYLGLVLDRASSKAGVHGLAVRRHGDRRGRGERS